VWIISRSIQEISEPVLVKGMGFFVRYFKFLRVGNLYNNSKI
jgi:hypothetical protein